MERTDKTTSTCFIVFILNCKIETKFITQFKNKYTKICLQLNKKKNPNKNIVAALLVQYVYTHVCQQFLFPFFRRISRHFLKTCGFKLLSVDETAVEAVVRHPGPTISDYDVYGKDSKNIY